MKPLIFGALYALASLILAGSLALAVWLRSGYEGDSRTLQRTDRSSPYYRPWREMSRTITVTSKADWQDPLAIFILVLGAGSAATLAAFPWAAGTRKEPHATSS